MFGLVLTDDCATDANDVMKQLKAYNIDTRPFFVGMHEQPIFKDNHSGQNGQFPVSEHLAQRGFYLPSGLKTSNAMIQYICDVLKEAIL